MYGPEVTAQNVVVVGDTPLGVECAKESGCPIIAVATGSYSLDDLASSQPDFCCAQLTEARRFLALKWS
ncbi:hypothetical protein AJ79_05152 [Helicocarpus griseus UAMH5409]|uniref:Uncharacterized protein n=1 Tax=Helicocarpus griseus UAMH5409 TaxID=1447875 RepID=A0A2B7XQF6_9EURO|nr:hypothetical protein AJ79_05152 [Helicocarpus griseus UAMH5409]